MSQRGLMRMQLCREESWGRTSPTGVMRVGAGISLANDTEVLGPLCQSLNLKIPTSPPHAASGRLGIDNWTCWKLARSMGRNYAYLPLVLPSFLLLTRKLLTMVPPRLRFKNLDAAYCFLRLGATSVMRFEVAEKPFSRSRLASSLPIGRSVPENCGDDSGEH